MARPREYTADKLEKAVRRYFRSITRQAPQTEMVPTGQTDERGHMTYRPEPVINDLGKQLVLTEYLVPPNIADLCEALRIHRSTWANYCDADQYPEFAEITEGVKARMQAWNERELLTRPGKDVKGIIFNLQQNYGYGGEKHEMELSGGALEAMLKGEIDE